MRAPSRLFAIPWNHRMHSVPVKSVRYIANPDHPLEWKLRTATQLSSTALLQLTECLVNASAAWMYVYRSRGAIRFPGQVRMSPKRGRTSTPYWYI